MENYTILTGTKNNAGDFLIAYRARKLLEHFRGDRNIIEYNAWVPLSEAQIERINESKALILTGGPSIQYNMHPGIYPLTNDLAQIKVPIITFGAGYKDLPGSKSSALNYQLSKETIRLLERISESGLNSSLRDYNTQIALSSNGFDNFEVTGCPALFDMNRDENKSQGTGTVFSLGVNYKISDSLKDQQKKVILRIAKNPTLFGDLIVAFHHSIRDQFDEDMLSWLDENNIEYRDISNSVDGLLSLYSNAWLHVGYRVHAHIFMSSQDKASLLIAEDGRGLALKDVISGLIVPAYHNMEFSLLNRIMKRLSLKTDLFNSVGHLDQLVEKMIELHNNEEFKVIGQVRANREFHFDKMKNFLQSLP